MPTSFRREEVTIGDIDNTLNLLPEEIFFKDREEGKMWSNTVPQPDGVKHWNRAKFRGEDVHVADLGSTFYVLADTTVFGYTMFRYLSSAEDDSLLRIAFQRGNRIIAKERSNVIMANLSQLAGQYGPSMNPMSLDGGNTAPAPSMAPVSGEGIASGVDVTRLRKEALTRGYVAGYVMGNAPARTMNLATKKDKQGVSQSNIVAKESKPSRCLAVLMALPANCVMRNGTMAQPSDIEAGAVEYATTDKNEMIYQSFTPFAAISYIYALGGRLPEYAPNVSNADKQWTAEDILGGKPEVSFVYVKAIPARSAKSKSPFRFALKTTSGRRSLYTDRNIVCLRALEHASVKISSEEDAYEVNNMAFAHWKYNKKNTENESSLQKAMNRCPSQIWKVMYTVNGVEKEGIGSAFFMLGSTVNSASGEAIAKRPLSYVPWWPCGDQKPEVLPVVQTLVKREFQPADGDKKERMVTKPLYYKDVPNDPLFKGYARFVSYIEKTGYLTHDALIALGSRTTKSKAKSFKYTPEERSALEYFMRDESVNAEIQAVRDAVTDRSVLRGK